MIPKVLTPDVLRYAEILLAGLPPAAPSLTLVCAWCTPRVTLEQLHRQAPGRISHGICAPCVDRMLALEDRS